VRRVVTINKFGVGGRPEAACRVLQCVTVCCSAVCYSVLQPEAACRLRSDGDAVAHFIVGTAGSGGIVSVWGSCCTLLWGWARRPFTLEKMENGVVKTGLRLNTLACNHGIGYTCE